METTKPTAPEHLEQHELRATPTETAVPIATVEESELDYSVAFRTWAAIAALALANCNATLSNTTNTIIKYQVQDVGGASLASWIANSNFLLTLACGPIFGYLADRLGKLWFIVGGCAVGVVGSFISSSAQNVHTIIGGNILTGIANAGCIVSIAANQEIVPSRVRPYVFGFAQTINSIAAVVGTFTAGAFAQAGNWQWSYRLNGIVYAIAGISVLLSYRPPPTAIRRTTNLREIILGCDFIGVILLAGSFACIVIALTWGGSQYAWSSGMIVGLLVGGCIGLVVFGLYEWKGARSNAVLDHRLFDSANFPILCFICLIDGMLLLGVNVLYSHEIPAVFGGDAVRTAVILSPYLITSTLGCLPAGLIMGRTKAYRTLLVSALLFVSLFTGLMALLNPDRVRWALAFSALFGVGTAVTTVIPIVALGLSVPSFLLGTAGTLSISSRALGGITGVTVYTAIYDNKFAQIQPHKIDKVLVAANERKLLPLVLEALSSPAPAPVSLAQVPGLPGNLIGPIVKAVAAANAEAYKYVWITIMAIVLGGAIACLFLKSVKADMNSHVESALEHSTTRDLQMGKKTVPPEV
ncbi:hypothetical protein PV08_00020 [Exophiala spinifera]|uniref:Major facilitator superfamily (MFS) profile domain-containing protein n=1 Tax=Exophiala spinifera TaxID=91928 RepID=A0A0D2BKJ0_9EURO|nr:uncharacterized protein PV08_00020 [Exophiala spinifera]KIW19448.1 hypothetical protein PV08_00020 [Exophiala spinifera]